MSSYCAVNLSVNYDLPPKVYVGPAKVSPPSPDSPGCQVLMYKGYTEIKGPVEKKPLNLSRGDRSKISGFSSRSRNKLLKTLFSLSRYPTYFITLTYQFYPADSKEWKRHLDNFRRRLIEKFPKAWFFWKLEPQKSGAPHYHLVGEIGDKIHIQSLRRLVSWLWFDVCGTGSEKHLKAGTQVKIINNSFRQVQAYVSKYISKVDSTEYSEWAHPGRFWGIFGRENMPESTVIAITMDKAEFFVVRRLIRRWLKSISPKCLSYSKRLAQIPSFFILIPREQMDRFLDLVLGRVPF